MRLSTRPRRKDLETFDGKIEKFRAWWTAVKEHVAYTGPNFASDDEKIAWLGGFLRDNALRWHQSQTELVKKLGVTDNWVSYVRALE